MLIGDGLGWGGWANNVDVWWRALLSACRILQIPNASARHHLDEMTPVQKIKSKQMQPGQVKTLERASVQKRPAARSVRGGFQVVGGDNTTEAAISRVKGQLRRRNMIGRMSPAMSHVLQLASKRLLEEPGLYSVLRSLGEYRRHVRNAVGFKPTDWADDMTWLR